MIFLWINCEQFVSRKNLFVIEVLVSCGAKQLEDIITSFMKLWIFLTSLIVSY